MVKRDPPIKMLGETETRLTADPFNRTPLDTADYFNRKLQLSAPISDPMGRNVLNPYTNVSDQNTNLLSAMRVATGTANPINEAILNGLVNPNQLSQLIRAPNAEFDGDMLSALSSTGFASNRQLRSAHEVQLADELLLPRIRKEANFVKTVTRKELDALRPDSNWFKSLTKPNQLIVKQLMLTNPAQTFDATELEAPAGALSQPFADCLPYLPQYADGHLQPCNLIFKDENEELQFYSIFIAGEAIYAKMWVRGQSTDIYARYHNGNYHLVRLNRTGDEVQCEILHVDFDASSLFAPYGNLFRIRYNQYYQAVAKRVPKRNPPTTEQIAQEALSLYKVDMVANTQYHFSISAGLPKLGQYRGPLSQPTGRKMSPHDRQPHFSYRYNPDGTVRIKFPVKAAEVNGGAKEKLGLQISQLKTIK